MHPQLAKAQKLVAAVPAVLSTIRSSSGGRSADAAAAPDGVPATPFAGPAGAGGLPPLHRRSPTGGSGVSESPDVERLLSRIPSEFRADVARMLLNSQEKAASGCGPPFCNSRAAGEVLVPSMLSFWHLCTQLQSVVAVSAWRTDVLRCTSLKGVISKEALSA